jgi:NitT/TauT family transport system substrate-binding protein
MKSLQNKNLSIILLIIALLPGCVPAKTTSAPNAKSVTLRIAILPIVDTLPLFVAQQERLFKKHGVNVEIIPVASAPERDQLMAAKQADGMINEIVTTLFYNKDSTQIQIVRYALTSTPKNAHFYILASGKSGIKTPDGLKNINIGVSQGTIIEYVTDRILEAEGLKSEEIKTVAVPKISDRMALLTSGELQAATMPDPLSALAIQQGAVVVASDSQHTGYGDSTIAFRKEVIDAQPEVIRAFLTAVEEATTLINADPSKYIGILSENKIVPPQLAGSFTVPNFPVAGVPTEAQWNDALAWAKDKGLISTDVSYAESVNKSFLP